MGSFPGELPVRLNSSCDGSESILLSLVFVRSET